MRLQQRLAVKERLDAERAKVGGEGLTRCRLSPVTAVGLYAETMHSEP